MMVIAERTPKGVGRGTTRALAFSTSARQPARRSVVALAAIAGLLVQTLPNAAAWAQSGATIAYTDGRWFDGTGFERKDVVYSIDGRISFSATQRVDETIDLGGAWVVPPFADAHNHSISNGGDEEADKRAIARFLADGVFYVKIPGNVPLSAEKARALAINRSDGLDVSFGNGSITGSNGHPIPLVSSLSTAGLFAGHTPDTLRDLRYFVVDSEMELNAKWPLILGYRPDFIKAILVFSEEHETYERDPSAVPPLDGRTARKGVNPRVLPMVVQKAHSDGLRVSAHVSTITDFRNALEAGVDEISHLLPRRAALTVDENTDLTVEDAREVAQRGIVVVTTFALPANIPDATRAALRRKQGTNLGLMHDGGVRVAIGTDNPDDTSVQEATYVRELGVLDNLTVLKMWVEITPATIFPNRPIGHLREGFEASFLALSGDPLTDFENVRRITLRVKQGRPLVSVETTRQQ